MKSLYISLQSNFGHIMFVRRCLTLKEYYNLLNYIKLYHTYINKIYLHNIESLKKIKICILFCFKEHMSRLCLNIVLSIHLLYVFVCCHNFSPLSHTLHKYNKFIIYKYCLYMMYELFVKCRIKKHVSNK